MKQILLLFLIGLTSNLIFAQDIIVQQNGDEIKSKILEITSETIKYKEFTFQEGPIRNINISDVFMVIYENGKREIFTTTEIQTSKENTKNKVSNNDYTDDCFMLGTGYGNSYGGLGIRAQWRTRGKQGWGIHAGAGFSYYAPILVSTGVKYFPYKGFYINAQFGFTDIGYRSIFPPGVSLLVGSDWTWGSKIGYGFNAGIGVTHNMNLSSARDRTRLALDLGCIIRF